MKYIIASVTFSLLLGGCTWVNENQAGRTVNITVIDQVANCTKVGNINASVKHKLGFIPRNNDKVTRELQTLARNEAVKLQATDIVADGPPNEGRQHYQAFRCN